MKKVLISLAVLISLTGCYTEADHIQERAKTVKACVDAGGEWYSTPGWGENCNFDTRK